MRKMVDLLPVSLHELKVSAFHRVWIKLGMGIQVRARTTESGYDLRIRYGKDDTIKKSSIRVEYGARWANNNPRPTLSCAVCGKLAFQNLYLDTKDWRWKCAPCHGVKPWQVRVPMRWDIGEETKFRKLLRRKIDEDILKFEMAALQTLKPEEFFAARPYLLPPWLEPLKQIDAIAYKHILKFLHGKCKAAFMRRRIQFLNEKENKWLMEKLYNVIERSSIITKKEIAWLRQQKSSINDIPISHRTVTLEQLPTLNQSEELQSGSQPGTTSAASGSQPLETGYSSKKMSSGLAMSAGAVEVEAKLLAQIVEEQAATQGTEETK